MKLFHTCFTHVSQIKSIIKSKKTYITTSSVARHAVREEEAHTVVAENTLLHGETLLVVSSSNATTSTPRRENCTGRRNP